MYTFYNKLVRDRIPAVIENNGNHAAFYYLKDEEMIANLKRKLAEEVAEFLEDASAEELADIEAVVDALKKWIGPTAVMAARQKKREERGEFDLGVYLLFESNQEGEKT